MNPPTSETPETPGPSVPPTPPMPERLAIDLDGVLVNFTEPLAVLASSMFNLNVSSHATHWDWIRDYGVMPDQETALWQWIMQNPEWWGFLPPLEYARMGLAYLRESGADVYFITARPGVGVKSVTENWLRFHGYPDPTVLIASNKAPIIDALKIDVFIDDRPENCSQVVAHTTAAVYMPTRPWNEAAGEIAGVHRVATLIDALQAVGIARGRNQ